MEISVIIPVYNAEEFVERAVLSALAQPETAEVLLIEDASTDGSPVVCQNLADEYEKVKLFQHKDGKNHGPGASRNIGLINAGSEFIAFLDADDYYVDGRFVQTKEVFDSSRTAEGVYEYVQRYCSDGKMEMEDSIKPERVVSYKTTAITPPGQLFEQLIFSNTALISLDGLVLKKSVLLKNGMFDEELIQGEDTDFILRLSLNASLFPGCQEFPVCFSELHGKNVTMKENEAMKMKWILYEKWFRMLLKNNWPSKLNRVITNRLFYYHPLMAQFKNIFIFRITMKTILLSFYIFKNPALLNKIL